MLFLKVKQIGTLPSLLPDGCVNLNCCSTSLTMVWQSRQTKVPLTNSGWTGCVLTTFNRGEMEFRWASYKLRSINQWGINRHTEQQRLFLPGQKFWEESPFCWQSALWLYFWTARLWRKRKNLSSRRPCPNPWQNSARRCRGKDKLCGRSRNRTKVRIMVKRKSLSIFHIFSFILVPVILLDDCWSQLMIDILNVIEWDG